MQSARRGCHCSFCISRYLCFIRFVSTFFHTSNLLPMLLPGDTDFQVARPWKQQRGQQNPVVNNEESEDEESESEEEMESEEEEDDGGDVVGEDGARGLGNDPGLQMEIVSDAATGNNGR